MTMLSLLRGTANFTNASYSLDEPLLVAEMTPVVHYVSALSPMHIVLHLQSLTLARRLWAGS